MWLQVPALEVQPEGSHDAVRGRRVVRRTYTFHVRDAANPGGRAAVDAKLEALEGGLAARLPCTVAARVRTRLSPQPSTLDQKRPRIAEKLLIYRAVRTLSASHHPPVVRVLRIVFVR